MRLNFLFLALAAALFAFAMLNLGCSDPLEPIPQFEWDPATRRCKEWSPEKQRFVGETLPNDVCAGRPKPDWAGSAEAPEIVGESEKP